MKIAILLFGEYREFLNTIPSYQLLDDLDVDYYISTWNVSEQKVSKLNIHIKEQITEDKILKYFPNSKINLETKFDEGDIQVFMNYHWKKLGEMIKSSGKSYDVIILKRMDTYFTFFDKQKLKEHTEPSTIYVSHGLQIHEGRPFIDDTTYIANQDNMLSFTSNMIHTFESHYGLADYIKSINLNVKEITCFENFILRPNMRKYITEDHRKNCIFLEHNFEKFSREYTDHYHNQYS